MQIVTDTGMDMWLTPDLMPAIPIQVVPHTITLDGKTYRSGEDIRPEELQQKLLHTDSFPMTSQPAAGDFAAMYKKLAATGDKEILSIHMSSGLSGTVGAAQAGADLTPEADVTVVDTKTLTAVQGWEVAAAGRAISAGWTKDQIVALIQRIGAASESLYTLDDLKYLIHGGRISHMKGLLASLLHLRPLIGVEKVGGTYAQMGVARTFDQALHGLVNAMLKAHPRGSQLRVQVFHSYNEPAARALRQMILAVFDCQFQPINYLSPVLAAHTGPTMVGVAFAPQAAFTQNP